MPGRRRRRAFLATTVILAVVAAGATALWLDHRETPRAGPPPAGDTAGTPLLDIEHARSGLDRLTIAWNRKWESYQRNAFGPGWTGRGGEPELTDGCTARDAVMKRDLTETQLAKSNSCTVLAGTLHDPYTGAQLPYDRYHASEIEIDHVVALGDAWRSGASDWDADRRERFANDVGNLLAVQKQANQDKGSRTPDQWKPRQSYQCDYARRWVSVKGHWGLTVQPTEKRALADMLATCAPPANR